MTTNRVFSEARSEHRQFVATGAARLVDRVNRLGGESTAELARATMIPPATTYAVLTAAEKRGEVRSLKDGAVRRWYPMGLAA